MAFRNNYFAKVWGVRDNRIRISTNYKDKEGNFVQDFNGWVSLYGSAAKKEIKAGDRIQLKSVGVTNRFDKEKEREYVNYKCFALEVVDPSTPEAEVQPEADLEF